MTVPDAISNIPVSYCVLQEAKGVSIHPSRMERRTGERHEQIAEALMGEGRGKGKAWKRDENDEILTF